MTVWLALLLGTAGYPLWRMWVANRHSSLSHTVVWTGLAWLVWLTVPIASETWTKAVVYGALCLTACAGVAVLGARRPGVGAWNFVVGGLLAVLLLQLLEGLERFAGSPLRLCFVAATLAMSLLNYLPTRLGLAATAVAAGCALELAMLLGWLRNSWSELAQPVASVMLAAGPWLGFLLMRMRPAPASDFERAWLAFRDRWGVVWGQRLREQFNRAAHHAGWTASLGWHGLDDACMPPGEALSLLQSLCKRFGVE